MTESMTAAEVLAECNAIAESLPPAEGRRVSVVVGTGLGLGKNAASVFVRPSMNIRDTENFTAPTFAEAFAMTRAWCATYVDRRREDAERRLEQARADLAALDAEEAPRTGTED